MGLLRFSLSEAGDGGKRWKDIPERLLEVCVSEVARCWQTLSATLCALGRISERMPPVHSVARGSVLCDISGLCVRIIPAHSAIRGSVLCGICDICVR